MSSSSSAPVVTTSTTLPTHPVEAAAIEHPQSESTGVLLPQLWLLAWPVLAENVLHMFVGLNDTFLANHLNKADAKYDVAAAAAAVGTISYLLWLMGLISGALSTGSTALIARATGAKHRRLANSVCGQSILAAAISGLVLAAGIYAFAKPIVQIAGLGGAGYVYAHSYLRMLGWSIPFLVIMTVANACFRGAGNTLTPAITFIVVDIINIVFSWGWTFGLWHLPKLGFDGIALGTVMAYIAGGLIQLIVLMRGGRGTNLKLHLHRLKPDIYNLKRILRIGMPSGASDLVQWLVNFSMLTIINRMDTTLVSSAAHSNTVKIEGLSYLGGMAVATAAATMVGQSLGMKQPERARRSAYLAYLLGGGIMTAMGVFFILAGQYPSHIMSTSPEIEGLTTRCLFITGFCQIAFAAAMVFGGSLRGAGDTVAVMCLNLTSLVLIRFTGVLVVGWYLHLGLAAVWVVLAGELVIRGSLIFGRFLQGGWMKVRI